MWFFLTFRDPWPITSLPHFTWFWNSHMVSYKMIWIKFVTWFLIPLLLSVGEYKGPSYAKYNSYILLDQASATTSFPTFYFIVVSSSRYKMEEWVRGVSQIPANSFFPICGKTLVCLFFALKKNHRNFFSTSLFVKAFFNGPRGFPTNTKIYSQLFLSLVVEPTHVNSTLLRSKGKTWRHYLKSI